MKKRTQLLLKMLRTRLFGSETGLDQHHLKNLQRMNKSTLLTTVPETEPITH